MPVPHMLFTSFWLWFMPGPSRTVTLQEGKDAFAHARALLASNKDEEALERLLAIPNEPSSAATKATVATLLGEVAAKLQLQSRFELALRAREKALALTQSLHTGDHPDVVTSLSNVADCLYCLGRSGEALPKLEAVLAMMQRLFPEETRETSRALGNLAACLHAQGRSEEALPHFKTVLETSQRLFAGDHDDIAENLNNVGLCLQSLARNAEALPQLQAALAMRQRLHPGDHLDVANSLNSLGLCLWSLGRAPEALSSYDRALAMYRRLSPADDASAALVINNIAHCLQSMGRSEQALSRYEEALGMLRRLFREEHPDVALALNNLGDCLADLGRTSEALTRYEAALNVVRKAYEGDHPRVAMGLNNVGCCLQDLGRGTEALPRFEAAVTMLQRIYRGDHPFIAASLDGVALCLQTLGRSHEALSKCEEASAMRARLFREDHPDVATSLDNVAMCLVALSRAAEALPKSTMALAIRQRLFRGDHADTALSLNNVALCLVTVGRQEEALAHYQDALAMFRRLYSDDHPYVASGLDTLGMCLQGLGRHRKAAPLHEAALAIGRRLFHDDHPDVARSLQNLASCHIALGQPDEAGRLLSQAVDVIERLRGSARSLERSDLQAYVDFLRRWNAHEKLQRVEAQSGRHADAFYSAERGRGRGVLDLLAQSRLDPLTEASRLARERRDDTTGDRIEAVARDLMAAEAEVDRLFHAIAMNKPRSGSEDSARVRSEFDAQLRSAQARRRELWRTRSRLVANTLPMAEAARPGEIQSALRPGELLLAFTVGDQDSIVYVVPPAGEPVQALVIPFNAKNPALEPWLSGISHDRLHSARGETIAGSSRPGSMPADAGHRLFQSLIPDALWARIAKADRLWIAPHAGLHRVAFEALVVRADSGKEPRYWLDEGPPIAYVSSGSVLRWLRQRASDQEVRRPALDLLALGDPLFQPDASSAPVPETGALVVGVGQGPGARAGLAVGDVIVSYAGIQLADDNALNAVQGRVEREIAEGKRLQEPIVLRVWRGGKVIECLADQNELGIQSGPGGAREAWEKGYARRSLDEEIKARTRADDLTNLRKLLPLPGTRTEIQAIRRMLSPVHESGDRIRTILGADATESNLFELAPQACFLHLATHGIAEEYLGQSLSMIVLSMPRAPSLTDDGFLKLEDLFLKWRERLSCCRMVVLSACDTRVGPLHREDGVQALPLGFLYAGASSVVSTLWRVEDEGTAALMTDFYRRLGSGERDRLKAFTEARRTVRRKRPDPFHWASFLYFGAPD